MTELAARDLQLSWGEHGPASASFTVAVKNAYHEPPPGLSEGSWVELYDGGHLLWDGEIISIKPSVSEEGHRLTVDCGGMLSVAEKRGDLMRMWSHSGPGLWERTPGTPDSVGQLTIGGIGSLLDLRAAAGEQQNITGDTLAHELSALWTLDELTGGAGEISGYSMALAWDLTASNGITFAFYVSSGTILSAMSNVYSEIGTSGAYDDGSTVRQLPPGTSLLRMMMTATAAGAPSNDRFVTITRFDIYSAGRLTRTRLDEAMVDLATRPGLAMSATSRRVGAPMADLSVGIAEHGTNAASALSSIAAHHSQPFDWRFGLRRTFDVRPRLWTPDNDSRVIMCGPGFPGMTSWDVAEYDEDNPDYVKVVFGNKDSTLVPEGWPRVIYRPGMPTDENVRLSVIDFSDRILHDLDARAVGDYITATRPAEIPPDYVFRAHAERARGAMWPNDNTDLLARGTWTDMSDARAVGTLSGIAYDDASGWSGSNSPNDPTCLVLDGVDDYVNFGNLAQLNFGSGPMSVSCWFTLRSLGSYQTLVAKRISSGRVQGWQVRVTSSNQLQGIACYDAGSGQWRDGIGSTALAAGVLYHAVFVYPGANGDWRIYLNGVAEAMTPLGAAGSWNTDSTAGASLGAFSSTTGGLANNPLSGSIVEAIVYARALSAVEASQLYLAGPCIYDRSLARGTVNVEGTLTTRTGSTIKATHVTPIDYWVQNPSVGRGRPLMVTGTSVDAAAGRNALTIGTDWVYDEIGVRIADLQALPETIHDEEPVTNEEPADPWANWR